jgi:hypothetical protein
MLVQWFDVPEEEKPVEGESEEESVEAPSATASKEKPTKA